METTSKKCTKCNKEKPSVEFYKNNRHKTGLSSQCKSCCSMSRDKTKQKRYRSQYQIDNSESLSERAKEYRAENKDMIAERRKSKYQDDDPKIWRNRRLLYKYKITLDEYNKVLEGQGFVCAICGGINDSGNALSVDHDHSCCSGEKSCGKCLRGLLCQKCNTGLGYFFDSADLLKRAIEYIDKHKRLHTEG